MTIAKLQANIRELARQQVNGVAALRFGIVRSYDPVHHAATVLLMPEGVNDIDLPDPSLSVSLTGWMPVLTPFIGNGWGIACGLQWGDQVAILGQEGDAAAHVILGRCYSDNQRPPVAQAGEVRIVHESGSQMSFMADGSVQMVGPVTITGTLTVTGDATIGGIGYLEHLHGGVQSGGSRTGAPVGTGGGGGGSGSGPGV